MKNRLFRSLIFILLCICVLTGCKKEVNVSQQNNKAEITYEYVEYPLERNGVNLHLDCMSVSGKETGKDILLIHGVTYSSNEFDTDYEDYSLVRKLAEFP